MTDFTRMSDKAIRVVWRYDKEKFSDDCRNDNIYYFLLNSCSISGFCFFHDGTYWLNVNGDGSINGSTSTSFYCCKVSINSTQQSIRHRQ